MMQFLCAIPASDTSPGANINCQDRFHATPLRSAVFAQKKNVVAWLKEQGAVMVDESMEVGAELCDLAHAGQGLGPW